MHGGYRHMHQSSGWQQHQSYVISPLNGLQSSGVAEHSIRRYSGDTGRLQAAAETAKLLVSALPQRRATAPGDA